jgi:hypothetical protein
VDRRIRVTISILRESLRDGRSVRALSRSVNLTPARLLLEKDWESLKPLKSGGRWSHEKESTAKYIAGEEAITTLAQHGIAALCDPGN